MSIILSVVLLLLGPTAIHSAEGPTPQCVDTACTVVTGDLVAVGSECWTCTSICNGSDTCALSYIHPGKVNVDVSKAAGPVAIDLTHPSPNDFIILASAASGVAVIAGAESSLAMTAPAAASLEVTIGTANILRLCAPYAFVQTTGVAKANSASIVTAVDASTQRVLSSTITITTLATHVYVYTRYISTITLTIPDATTIMIITPSASTVTVTGAYWDAAHTPAGFVHRFNEEEAWASGNAVAIEAMNSARACPAAGLLNCNDTFGPSGASKDAPCFCSTLYCPSDADGSMGPCDAAICGEGMPDPIYQQV